MTNTTITKGDRVINGLGGRGVVTEVYTDRAERLIARVLTDDGRSHAAWYARALTPEVSA
jgi:hypothetical protein